MSIRAVLDANVLASALIQPLGASGRILAHLLHKQGFILISSASILAEAERCLFYPRIRKRIKGSDEEIHAFVHSLAVLADVVTPELEELGAVERDPDDDKYLAAAIEGRAQYVVTGDKDLLELKSYEGVSILTPVQFLAVIGA